MEAPNGVDWARRVGKVSTVQQSTLCSTQEAGKWLLVATSSVAVRWLFNLYGWSEMPRVRRGEDAGKATSNGADIHGIRIVGRIRGA